MLFPWRRMMSDTSKIQTYDLLLVIGLSIFFALPLSLIHLIIHINPSGALPPTPFASFPTPALMGIAMGLGFFGGVVFVLRTGRRFRFVLSFVFTFLFFMVLVVYLAIRLHRDYFTVTFQLAIIFYIIFLIKIDNFTSILSNRIFYRGLYLFSLVLALFFLAWILMMGYAISTRQEPRWIESVLYNIYNTLLDLVLIWAAFQVKVRLYKQVLVEPTSIIIDHQYDLSKKFSPLELALARFFLLHSDRAVTCSRLFDHLRGADVQYQGKANECEQCIADNFTATSCSYYKNFYNRILEIKKQFELFEIGTIISPENKLTIKETGWKFRTFDNIKITKQQ